MAETKELKIQIPEGYCIDESKSTFEKIVFKKKDAKPRSWEEYCNTQLDSEETRIGYTIGSSCVIYSADWDNGYNVCNCSTWRNVLPTQELAEAFLAMMQLMSLRQDWIHKWSIDNGLTEDWEPSWKGDFTRTWCVVFQEYELKVDCFYTTAMALSFPTKEMAEDFMNCFKDLLNIARPLI